MTLAEQRLNSNHGRLLHAANNLPVHLREACPPDTGWTARELLAHVLAWQEEALRRFGERQVRCLSRQEIDEWNAVAREHMRYLPWEEIVDRIQVAHVELTREIARRFNSFYAGKRGQVFPEPQSLLTPAAKLPGTDGRKMSKSYGNMILLTDPDVVCF